MAKRKNLEVDDWCFTCKDGGHLLVCDEEDCGKVYHMDCVGEEVSSFKDGEPWICGRHYCFNCQKPPQFYCLGCPHAVCNDCYAVAEFALVRAGTGLCCDCLELVFIIENNLDRDSHGNKVNLNDKETFEALFKEYWDIVKLKEGLTSDDVCATLNKYKMDPNFPHHRRFSDTDEKDQDSEYEDVEGEEEEEGCITYDTYNHKLGPKSSRSNSKEFIRWEPKLAQTKYRKLFEHHKLIGWGSKPVIAFLASTGKDIVKPLSQWAVSSLIRKYVEEKHLHHPNLKDQFNPDEKLFPIFQKRVVSINKIYSLLTPHIAENSQQTMEGKHDDENIGCFTYKPPDDQQSLLTNSMLKKGDYITRMSCFASINAENIKLIYLKQSLVREFSKQPESFEDKVIGTFVKIQGDPTDHCHLVRVTGVNKDSLLQVSFMPKAIAIHELSDDDFTEQECDALQQKVKDNLLPITVEELQAKAIRLHEDITKHWITKRLAYLKKRIEFANEKGRLREKDELIGEMLELEQPEKMEELLRDLPTVIPQLIHQRYDPDDPPQPQEQGM